MEKLELLFTAVCLCTKSLQLYLTLCDPKDCSPPGSSVHGISQVRVLEWIAVSFSRDLSDSGIKPTSPMASAVQADSLPPKLPGKLLPVYLELCCCC